MRKDNSIYPKKLSVTWLELLLIALFVAFGLAVWSFAQNQVTLRLASQQPQASTFELRASLPLHERKVAGSTTNLERLYSDHAILIDQERKAERKLMLLESEYPLLTSSVYSDTSPVSLDPIRSYWQTEQELESQEAFVQGLNATVTQLISTTAALSIAVTSSDYLTATSVITHEIMRLRYAEEELLLQAYQEKLAAESPGLLKQQIELDHLAAASLALSNRLGWSGVLSLTDIQDVESCREYWTVLQAVRLEKRLLLEGIQIAENTLISQTAVLYQAQIEADLAFRNAETRFNRRHLMWTVGILAVSLLFLFALCVGVFAIAAKNWAVRIYAIIGVSSGIILVLLAYEVWNALGAIVTATIILLSLLVGIRFPFTAKEGTS